MFFKVKKVLTKVETFFYLKKAQKVPFIKQSYFSFVLKFV